MKSELLTAENVLALKNTLIAEGILEETLMERAGKEVVDLIFKHFSPAPTIILCGPGKNGGDGKVVARLLKEKGWPVDLILFQDLPSFESIHHSLSQTALIVDALLVTGLSRPLEGPMKTLVELINDAAKPVVSIDIPTGIDADSGACWGDAVRATFTVTFFRARLGHYLLPGRLYTGNLFIKDIGIPDRLLFGVTSHLNNPSLWNEDLKDPQPFDHKYTRGACLVIGNGAMPGAVKLSTSKNMNFEKLSEGRAAG